MKIKLKDVELALEHIKSNSLSEVLEFTEGDNCISITFSDRQQKLINVYLFESASGITPEVRSITKLYRKI